MGKFGLGMPTTGEDKDILADSGGLTSNDITEGVTQQN